MKYFDISEFDSPDKPGSGSEMKPGFLEKLDKARGLAGIPFIVVSGVRTPSHNKEVGGTLDSSHISGWAADLKVTGSRQRFLTIKALLKAGFNRIGISMGTLIHVDCDPDKDKNVFWTY